MAFYKRIISLLVAFVAVCTVVKAWPYKSSSKAIYFLRVDPAGSSVVSVRIGSNGLLENETKSTSTGGVGLQSTNASAPAAPQEPPTAIDPLQGQDAVTVGGNYLFTVNSGSDTAVMFGIDPKNPLNLEMIGQPQATLGEFPSSIAYSEQYGKVCVLNSGEVNGVTCFSVDAQDGLVADGIGLRQTDFSSTTPAQLGGDKGSGSDIRFSPDSSKLVMTFKGNAVPSTKGHIVVFDVDGNGNVASTWTDNRIEPLSQVFGFAFDLSNQDNLLVTEATFGSALVSLDYSTDKISLIKVINNTAFAASCWTEYSTSTGLFYDINALATLFGKVNPDSGDLEGNISFDTSLGGAEDTVFDGTTAYFLTNTNIIAVLDLESGQLLQQFTYATPDNRPTWTGMALWSGEGGRW